jgi:hypothetical protein
MRARGVANAILRATLSGACLHWRMPAVAGLFACILLGCAADYQQEASIRQTRPSVPVPSQALLTPPSDPGCALKTSDFKDREGEGERASTRIAQVDKRSGVAMASDVPPSGIVSQPIGTLVQTDPNASLAARIKLEYERDCFRRAEARVRERLARLQSAVRQTIRAVRLVEQSPTR